MNIKDPISYDMDYMGGSVVQYWNKWNLRYDKLIILFISIFVNCSVNFCSTVHYRAVQYGQYRTVKYNCHLLDKCHVRIKGICANYFIGTMEFESTVILGKMELILMSYWNKWN